MDLALSHQRHSWLNRLLYSVRFKITLAAVFVVGVALFVASQILFTTLNSQLENLVINQAKTQETAIVSLVNSGSITNPLPLPRGDIEVQVLNSQNQVVASTANIAGQSSMLPSFNSPKKSVSFLPVPRRFTLSDPDESDRRAVLVSSIVGSGDGTTLRVTTASSGLTLRIGTSQQVSGSQTSNTQKLTTRTYHSVYRVAALASLATVDQSSLTVIRVVTIVFPFLLLVLAALVIFLTARALKPVERINREVSSITASNLHNRISVPPSKDEISELAVTMNQMLERLDESAERSKRFVADASHELRSPLSVIQTELEVGLLHPDGSNWQQTAAEVLEESRRMQRIVEDLLLLARADSGKTLVHTLLPVDMDELVLAEASRLRLAGELTIDTRAVSGGRVTGDPHYLHRVVRNLANNAVRHAISKVTFVLFQEDSTVRLEVGDDGLGVPEDLREKIFERFTRLDEARSRDEGGSGLGLSIVRTIVDAHGGTVVVTNNPDGSQGARFIVTLPRL